MKAFVSSNFLLRQAQWLTFGTRPVKSLSIVLKKSNHFLLYQLQGHAIFFEFVVSTIKHYHINALHLFCDRFK